MKSKKSPKSYRNSRMSIIEVKRTKDGNERLKRLKNKMLTSDCVKFSLNIPRHLHTKFKTKASENRTDMKTVLLASVLNYLEN